MNTLRRFFSHPQNLLGLALVSVFVLAALFAPLLSPDDPKSPGIFRRVGRSSESPPLPPSPGLPLGTLPGQIDVFHALAWGARQALTFGLTVILCAATFGSVWGLLAGLQGGWGHNLFMRITDAFLAFPVIAGVAFLNQLLLNALIASGADYFAPTQNFYTEPSGSPSLLQAILTHIEPLTLTLILFSWMPYARLMSGAVPAPETDGLYAGCPRPGGQQNPPSAAASSPQRPFPLPGAGRPRYWRRSHFTIHFPIHWPGRQRPLGCHPLARTELDYRPSRSLAHLLVGFPARNPGNYPVWN